MKHLEQAVQRKFMCPVWLIRLLSYSALGRVKILPEQRLSIDVANMLRGLSIEGKLRAVWSHPANEGKRSIIVGKILKAMGLISGTSDLLFLWSDGSGAIELKVGKNKESDNQTFFSLWCKMLGVRYEVCRSKEEVLAALIEWGVA